jgi:hypothetical protein
MDEKITNDTDLAYAMLDWKVATQEANELAEKIKQYVLELGKTQTVGNVRASYSKGRTKHHYDEAWLLAGKTVRDVPGEFQKVSYKWKEACEDAGIEDIPASPGTPSVTVKLLE